MNRPGLFPPPAASQVPCSSEHHSDVLRADPGAVPSTSSSSGSVQLWTSQCMVTLMFKVYFPCSTAYKWQPTACGVQAEQEQPALSVGEEREVLGLPGGLSGWAISLGCLHTARPLCSAQFLQPHTQTRCILATLFQKYTKNQARVWALPSPSL